MKTNRKSPFLAISRCLFRAALAAASLGSLNAQTTGNWNYNGTLATSNSWNTTGSWTGLTSGQVPNAMGASANFTLNITAARTITLDGDKTVGTLSIDDPTATFYAYTLGAGTPATSRLIFDVESGNGVLNTPTANNTQTNIIGAEITLNAPLVITTTRANVTGGLNLTGLISDGGSSYSITKEGNGAVTFGAANEYDGGTIINGGRIQAGAATALGKGSVTVNGGGQLYMATAATFANEIDIVGNGYANTSDAAALLGALRYQNSATSGTITLSGDARIGAFGNTTGIIAGPITGGMRNLEINSTANANHTGSITITGDASGLTGTVTVSRGGLSLGPESNLGGNVVVKDGATLSGEATIAGDLVLGNDGSVTTGPTLLFDPSTPTSFRASGDVTLNGTTVVAPSVPVTNSPVTVLTYGGNLAGSADNLDLVAGISTYRPGTAFDLATPGQINLSFAESKDIVWSAAVNHLWNVAGDSNWLDGATPSAFFTLDRVTFNSNIPASVTTALAGANNDLTFTARTPGAAGDDITIEYVDTVTPNTPLSLAFAGNAITVILAIDAENFISTTAADIKAAIEASPAASALVRVALAPANDGSGLVAGLEPLSLSRENATVSIPAGVTAIPSSTTFDCTTEVGYQLSGPGGLGGPGALVKTGAGQLTLTGTANSYVGGTVVSQGTLVAGATGSIAPGTITLGDANSGDSDITLVANGNTITNNILVSSHATGAIRIATSAAPSGGYGTGTITLQRDVILAPGRDNLPYNMVITGTGDVTISGGNRMQIQGAAIVNTWSGNLTIAADGHLQINNSGTAVVNAIPDTANVTVDGIFRLFSGAGNTGERINGLNGAATGVIEPQESYASGRTATLTIGISDGSGQFDGRLSRGAAPGTLAIAKSGSGVQVLMGVNTYTGATTINGGTLEIGGAGQLGGGTYTANVAIGTGATLKFNSTANQALQTGVVSGAGALIKENSGSLTLTGANTFSGDITVNGGTLIGAGATNPSPGVTVFGSRVNSRTITVNNGGTLQFRSGNILGANHVATTAPAIIINAGGVVTNAAPGTNNALNHLEINGGTLTATTGSPSGYAAWNLNGPVTSTGSSTISTSDPVNGTVMLNSTGDKTTDFNVISGTLTVSAPVVDNMNDGNIGSLSKSGAGSMTLSAANTYSGSTTIRNGALFLTGATHATTAIAFESGGVLGLDTGVSVSAASAAVNLANGAIKVTGTTGALSYTLLTAGSISGSPVLAEPVPGYGLQVVGNELRLVQSGASTPYEIWAGPGVPFDGDANNDGISNGLAFLLNAPGPNADAFDKLPKPEESASGLVMTFQTLTAAARGTAQLKLEYSNSLAPGSWTTVTVPDTAGVFMDGAVNFTITGTGPITVTATISAGAAAGGKLFGRVKATAP